MLTKRQIFTTDLDDYLVSCLCEGIRSESTIPIPDKVTNALLRFPPGFNGESHLVLFDADGWSIEICSFGFLVSTPLRVSIDFRTTGN